MKASVVMATYNGEKYIIEQLDTIRLQTITPDEVIICDDCSTDTTVRLVVEYIEQYGLQNSWKIIQNDFNLGYAGNFHKAADMAQGEFIFFADQDDLWVDNKIELMIKKIEEYADCQVLCTDYEVFADNGGAPAAPPKVLAQMKDAGSIEKIELSKKSVYLRALGCCMCVKKEFLCNIQKYWFDGWAQDDRMWRLGQCADGCYLWHKNLVKHRLHDNNTATFGKYHTKTKRVILFANMQNANLQMLRMLDDYAADEPSKSLIKAHIAMMKKRLDLLKNGKLIKLFSLICYLQYYQTPKSYLVDLYVALSRKQNQHS